MGKIKPTHRLGENNCTVNLLGFSFNNPGISESIHVFFRLSTSFICGHAL